jgi:hypothetical protein
MLEESPLTNGSTDEDVREKTQREPMRALSLDALRGLFILLMNLGFTIPNGVFPDWMYHRQYPSSHGGEYTPIPGLAWRDVTFASFLFTLAAAIPVTMTARMDRGMDRKGVVLTALRRGFLLFVFALIIGHSNPFWTNDYTTKGSLTAIAGYILCFLVFTRPRKEWNKVLVRAMQVAGWLGVIALFSLSPMLFGQAFSLGRRDDVIAILTFSAFVGILLWLATRAHPLARLAILACVVALHLAAREEGWAHQMWEQSPLPWFFEWSFLDVLLVVIPGTLAGDLLVDWMKSKRDARPSWSRTRLAGIALLALVIEPLLVVGLYNRWILATTAGFVVLCAVGAFLLRMPKTSTEIFLARLLASAAFWVFLGLILEPLGGGIKKIPGTMSYYFAVTGNAICLLAAFTIFFDILLTGRRAIQPIVDVGQNAMMGYMLLPMFVIPILGAANLYAHGVMDPLTTLVRSALLIFVVAVFTGFASRRKIFWRT